MQRKTLQKYFQSSKYISFFLKSLYILSTDVSVGAPQSTNRKALIKSRPFVCPSAISGHMTQIFQSAAGTKTSTLFFLFRNIADYRAIFAAGQARLKKSSNKCTKTRTERSPRVKSEWGKAEAENK